MRLFVARSWSVLLVGATLVACSGEVSRTAAPDGAQPTDDSAVGPQDGGPQADGPAVQTDGTPPDSAVVDQGPDAPPPRPLPDVSAAQVNCSSFTLGSVAKAKAIYDTYFAPYRPSKEADFQWSVDSKLLTPELVKQVAFYSPTTGQSNDQYHDLFDFDPAKFNRSTGKTNLQIFAGLDPKTDVNAPYKSFNPTDYVPATATHYARSSTSDVIATQFVFQVACQKAKMEQALTACPDCADAIVMLSKNDSYHVMEVRFARVNAGALEVSRPFKVVSVDCSGDMTAHSQKAPYQFAVVGGETLRAKWRGEISGYMAQLLGTYMHPTPILVRLSPVSPGY